MFNNKLHLGTIFGFVLAAPTILLILLTMTESSTGEGFYILIGICVLLGVASIGLFLQQIWAIKLTSFIIIGVYGLLLFTVLSEISYREVYYDIFVTIITMSFFAFGAVALLNNNIVLEQFGATETYDDLDDILDAE